MVTGLVERYHHRDTGLIGNGREREFIRRCYWKPTFLNQGQRLRSRDGDEQRIGPVVPARLGFNQPLTTVDAERNDGFSRVYGQVFAQRFGYRVHAVHPNIMRFIDGGIGRTGLCGFPFGNDFIS